MPKVADLADCPLCFGRLLPLSVCGTCNTVAVREGVEEIGPQITCEDCGATNTTHFVCSACNARFPYIDIVKPEGPTCPVCKHPVPVGAALCPNCSAVLPAAGAVIPHARRRIRGEFGEEDLHEVGRVQGVSRTRAEALCSAGYNALWKIARASEDELARVGGIGARASAQIKESLRFLLLVGRKKTKEEVLSEEYECPLCGTVTSLFATRCHDCGAEFDEEELDEEFRREVEREEGKGLLAYYDVRLLEDPGNPALHYARAVLLLSMGRPADALASLDRALELRPADPRALQAKTRALGAAKGVGSAAQVLKDLVQAASPTALPRGASEEEAEGLAALRSLEEGAVECPECGEKQVPGAAVCPVCGHRFGPPAAVPAESEISLDEERLLDELERAVAGEAKAPPPPLKPEVPAAVVDRKRAMLTFLLKVPGVSRRAAEAVSGFFQDLDQVNLSEVADLAEIPGVAPAEARLIREAVERHLGPGLEEVVPRPPETPIPRPAPARTPTRPAPAAEAQPAPAPVPPARPSRIRPEAPALRRPFELEGRRGLINGRGLVNGRGRVNGLINGTGFVNGSSVAEMHLPRKSLLPRYIAIGAAMIMLFGVAVALVPPSGPPGVITIDGAFDDWSGVASYTDATVTTNASVQISAVSVKFVASHLYLRVDCGGILFANLTAFHTVYAFIDLDPGQPTGYDLGDMRADFLARISGARNQVEDARLMSFSGGDPLNWNNWTTVHAIDALAGPTGSTTTAVEVDIPADSLGQQFAPGSFLLRVVVDDNAGLSSHSAVPIRDLHASLLVEQSSAAGNTIGTGLQGFLRLRFRAFGGAVTITDVAWDVENATRGSPSEALPWTVPAGGFKEVIYSVNNGATPGLAISARVTAVTTSDTGVPVAIIGTARAYAVQVFAVKRIDGLFSDWADQADSDARPIRRPSLDIQGWNGSVIGDTAYLYSRLNGAALEGNVVAGRVGRPSQSGGGGGNPAPSGPPPPAIGLDFVRFYLRTDAAALGGYDINGLAANRLVEVRGRGSVIRDATIYEWSAGTWRREGAAVAALGGSEIEVGASIPSATFNATEVVAITGDWAGIGDMTDPGVTRGTRGTPGLILDDGSGFQTVAANPLTNTPTVDGECGDPTAEYDGADTGSNANMSFKIGAKNTFVYVCILLTADTTDGGTADWAHLLFDRDHGDETTPQAEDRLLERTSGGAGGTFTQKKGDGAGWVDCGGSCYSGNTAYGMFNGTLGHEVYEFKVSFWDVWDPNGNSTITDTAGFAIYAFNSSGSSNYAWGSNTVNENNPSTWGRLDIPEFSDFLAVGVATIAVIGFGRRRRRG